VLRSCGADIVSETRRRAGILAFTMTRYPPSVIGAALAAAGVTATVRREHVRLSPHASTTSETIALLRTTLASLDNSCA
jgi:selenocysteine lyase/cysteine desulfurase